MVTVECAIEPSEGVVVQDAGGVRLLPVVLAKEDANTPRDSRKGTKLSPICIDADMKRDSTSLEELEKQCFPKNFSLIEAQLEVVPGVMNALYSTNSTSTMSKHNMYSSEGDMDTVLTKLMKKSEAINRAVVDRSISRHGRSQQRWLVDATTPSKVTRLVTGCVPILSGEKIMLVSASKKSEWILPKGGWEMDEEMEESAIRETFEEAGVIGVLGPKLTAVHYETRKARERRLSSLEDKVKAKSESDSQFRSGWSDVSQLSEDDHIVSDQQQKNEISQSKEKPRSEATVVSTESELTIPNVNEEKSACAGKQKNEGQAAESTMIYSHVCVCLFPLYVKDVKSTWPESGRLRRSADIDEAIELLAKRPEMQSILREVKARGLHRV